jgi:hypothetical protein
MPINCREVRCPLTSADPLPKFCPECGEASATKVVQAPPACKDCGCTFGSTIPKFCPDCGTKTAPAGPTGDLFTHYGFERPTTAPTEPGEKPYGSVAELIARHDEARGRAKPSTVGRGLTAEEVERMTSNARRGRAADRTYSERPADSQDVEDYKSVSGLSHFADDEESRQHAGVVSRKGVQGQGGAAEGGRFGSKGIGALSERGARLDPDYHEHVRVLPYSFKTPTHSGRQILGTGQAPEDKGGQLTPEEAAFYSTDQLDSAAAQRLLKADPDTE